MSWKDTMADRIEFDSSRAADFNLHVDVGEPEAFDGRTSVTFDGDGRMTIEHETTQDDEQPFAAAPLDWRMESDARTLLAAAASFDWTCPFPPRMGLPDEAIVRWTLRERGVLEVTCKTWLRDAEKNEAMRFVLDAVRAEIEKATKGMLFL
jgi:hypothetical protein